MPDPTDPTLDTLPVTICTQIIQCLSIFSACYLYLKPFLDSVESGFIRSGDIRRRGSDYYTYQSGGSFTIKNGLSRDSAGRSRSGGTRMKSLSRHPHTANVKGRSAANKDDEGSQHSQTQIIQETRTFTVESCRDVRNTPSHHSDDLS